VGIFDITNVRFIDRELSFNTVLRMSLE
jgi:hypothetical protein